MNTGFIQANTAARNASGGNVQIDVQASGGLGHNPCRITGGSSLVQTGRGGLAPFARDLLGPLRGVHDQGVPGNVMTVGGLLPSLPDDPSYFSASWRCANDGQTPRS
ncbi:MAG: hypothetical protein AW09_004350 [Candidatus Accumulibacter phosphatis]|uniref:Uncharacterized protein n=1 Tax=Candidatus Accumulibacter phosphatis TaxID=327160 RepID=A0A080LR04_9PROT|nr:MAG: hypothetical protein AW09_004350 [Candidatus Accumulibacter phosphatis]